MTTAPRRNRLLVAAALGVPGLLAVAWLVGFAWFLHAAWTPYPAETLPAADGIVALTGGADRVETALHLLAGGQGRVLLVSGVGGATEFSALARRARIDPTLGVRVTLGRLAVSTRGNAQETAEWARANGVRSLLVVTAGYHMPRALAELARALPDVLLHPVPIVSQGMRGRLPLRLLAGEYAKYLIAVSGLSRWASPDVPGAPRAEARLPGSRLPGARG